MNKSIVKGISRSTLKRLPLYLHLLEKLQSQGLGTVSCTQIAGEFAFNAIQVRKDIETTGIIGTSRIGFNVSELIVGIKNCLGWNNTRDAFLIGAGNMGKALLGYRDFERYGLDIVAVFDKDRAKIGTQIFGREVLPLEKVPGLVRRMHVHIGIVTVPADQAQEIVDILVEAGICAIWNFAPAPLRIPDGVILENARLTQSLAVLTNKLSMQFKK